MRQTSRYYAESGRNRNTQHEVEYPHQIPDITVQKSLGRGGGQSLRARRDGESTCPLNQHEQSSH